MTPRKSIIYTSLLALLPLAAVHARATTITQLTSAGQLSSGDSTIVDTDAPGTVYTTTSANPLTINGSYQTATFQNTTGIFEADQAGVNYGDTAFANGTQLIGSGGFQGPGGPLTITFENPTTQFGVNIEDFNGGVYNVVFDAYDPNGVFLGQFNDLGDDPISGSGGTLSFEGLNVSGDTIGSIVFNDTLYGDSGTNNMMIGNLEYALNAPTSGSGGPSPVPEPSSMVLLGTGLVSIAFFSRLSSAKRLMTNKG